MKTVAKTVSLRLLVREIPGLIEDTYTSMTHTISSVIVYYLLSFHYVWNIFRNDSYKNRGKNLHIDELGH